MLYNGEKNYHDPKCLHFFGYMPVNSIIFNSRNFRLPHFCVNTGNN
jgi:hypothetical protein